MQVAFADAKYSSFSSSQLTPYTSYHLSTYLYIFSFFLSCVSLILLWFVCSCFLSPSLRILFFFLKFIFIYSKYAIKIKFVWFYLFIYVLIYFIYYLYIYKLRSLRDYFSQDKKVSLSLSLFLLLSVLLVRFVHSVSLKLESEPSTGVRNTTRRTLHNTLRKRLGRGHWRGIFERPPGKSAAGSGTERRELAKSSCPSPLISLAGELRVRNPRAIDLYAR